MRGWLCDGATGRLRAMSAGLHVMRERWGAICWRAILMLNPNLTVRHGNLALRMPRSRQRRIFLA